MMTTDLRYLALTAILTAALWIPYVGDKCAQRHGPTAEADAESG
jgi:hypothetical protein